MMKPLLVVAALISMAISTTTALAQQTLEPITFMDQWGKPQVLNLSTKWLIFTDNKDSGTWVKTQLENLDGEALMAKNTVYIADVSGMPSLITKFIAIPKMQDYSFPIALETQGVVSKAWPKKEGAVNVYQLSALTITNVHALTSQAQVSAFFTSIGLSPRAP